MIINFIYNACVKTKCVLYKNSTLTEKLEKPEKKTNGIEMI